MIEFPILGKLEEYRFDEWLRSAPVRVNVLGGSEVRFILENYEEDDAREEFHQAVENFLALDKSALKQAQDHLFRYYRDICAQLDPDDDEW